MPTRYLVRVADTATDPERGHETTVRCTCGWSVDLTGADAAVAVQVAARARANHLEDAHPGQSTGHGPSGADGHDLLLGGSTKHDHLWVRHAVCSCGDWTVRATERSPDRVAALVRTQHRDHVHHETGRTPARDYVVLAGLVAVVTVVLLVLFASAVNAGGYPG